MATASLPTPSHQRVEPGSVNVEPGTLPATAVSKNVDAANVAEEIMSNLNTALSQKDFATLETLFLPTSYLRSHLALTWALRTIKGRDNIIEFLKSDPVYFPKVQISKSSAFRSPALTAIDAWGEVQGVQFFIEFETDVGKGEGTVRLAEVEEGKWGIFTIAFTLTDLKQYPEPVGEKRVNGVQHGGNPDRKTWLEGREEEKEFRSREPAVVIIGQSPDVFALAGGMKNVLI